MSNFPEQFALRAREWAEEKVPFQHMGDSRNGCDCTGLLIGCARELGYLKKYELRKYPMDWASHSMGDNYVLEELKKFADEIPKNQSEPGDIILMCFDEHPIHTGILVEDKLFVHICRRLRYCRFGLLRNSIWSYGWIKTFRSNETKMAQLG